MKATQNIPAVLKSFSSLVAAALMACGCAGVHHQQLTLAPVGPATSSVTGSKSMGELEVFSALQAGYVQDKYGEMQNQIVQQFSRYKIFRPDGQLLQEVDNDRGDGALAPETVTLAPGTYLVKARARGYGRVTVPVVIASGERTVVHLEGGRMWADASAFSASNAICLPNGTIAGWKAQGSSWQ